MTEITFEQLPQAVTLVIDKLESIEKLIREKDNEPQPEPERWFNLNELCEYLPDKPSKPTVYGWVQHNLIPCHKGAKRLRFLKSEIDNWLRQSKKRTLAEAASEAEKYCKINRGN